MPVPRRRTNWFRLAGLHRTYTTHQAIAASLVVVLLSLGPTAPASDPAVNVNQRASQDVGLMLDHVPIAVADLRGAERDFQTKLGFSIKPGRIHPNSIGTRHIRFADDTALELITAGRPDDALAQWYVTFVRAGEGPAFLAFSGLDSDLAASLLAAAQYEYRLARNQSVSTLATRSSCGARHLD